jgi:hypothetical protein
MANGTRQVQETLTTESYVNRWLVGPRWHGQVLMSKHDQTRSIRISSDSFETDTRADSIGKKRTINAFTYRSTHIIFLAKVYSGSTPGHSPGFPTTSSEKRAMTKVAWLECLIHCVPLCTHSRWGRWWANDDDHNFIRFFLYLSTSIDNQRRK